MSSSSSHSPSQSPSPQSRRWRSHEEGPHIILLINHHTHIFISLLGSSRRKLPVGHESKAIRKSMSKKTAFNTGIFGQFKTILLREFQAISYQASVFTDAMFLLKPILTPPLLLTTSSELGCLQLPHLLVSLQNHPMWHPLLWDINFIAEMPDHNKT